MLVNWVSIGSDNGLSPDRHQAIILTNARILLIGPLGTNFNEILTIAFAKWRQFCPGRDESMGVKSGRKVLICADYRYMSRQSVLLHSEIPCIVMPMEKNKTMIAVYLFTRPPTKNNNMDLTSAIYRHA